jgi:O-antigen/teichoic acid export membrane protein
LNLNKLSERVSSLKRLWGSGKGLALVTSGNAIAAILGGLFWFLMATILPVTDYGKLNFHISIATVASLVSLLGLNTAIIAFIPKGNLSLRDESIKLSFFSGAIAAIIAFILLRDLTTSLLVLALTIFTMSWSNAIGSKYYRTYFFRMVAQRSSQIGVSFILYFYLGIDGLLLGYALTSVAFSYDFFRFLKFNFHFTELKKKSTFVVHSYFQSLSISLGLYLDKLIIAPLFGFATLGLYQMSFQFLMFLSLIPLSLYQFLVPRESIQQQSNKLTLLGMTTAIIACSAFFFIIPAVVESFFPKFTDSVESSRIIVLGLIPMTLTSILASKFIGREKTKPIVLSSLVYIGLLLSGDIILGTFFGLIGLSVSVVISLTGQSIGLLACLKYLKADSLKAA